MMRRRHDTPRFSLLIAAITCHVIFADADVFAADMPAAAYDACCY